MVFGGTLVAYGKGVMVVTSTGDKTEMGRIAQNLIHEDIPTPLQQRLGKLSANHYYIRSYCSYIMAYMIIKLNIKGQINIDTSGILVFLQSIKTCKRCVLSMYSINSCYSS